MIVTWACVCPCLVFSMTEWMTDVYEKPYCRVGVYAVGIALGYLLHRVPSRPKIHPVSIYRHTCIRSVEASVGSRGLAISYISSK